MILTEHTADRKVAKLQQQGHDIEWEGWSLNYYFPNRAAWRKKNGAFRNGQWCIKRIHNLNDQGKWVLPGIKFE